MVSRSFFHTAFCFYFFFNLALSQSLTPKADYYSLPNPLAKNFEYQNHDDNVFGSLNSRGDIPRGDWGHHFVRISETIPAISNVRTKQTQSPETSNRDQADCEGILFHFFHPQRNSIQISSALPSVSSQISQTQPSQTPIFPSGDRLESKNPTASSRPLSSTSLSPSASDGISPIQPSQLPSEETIPPSHTPSSTALLPSSTLSLQPSASQGMDTRASDASEAPQDASSVSSTQSVFDNVAASPSITKTLSSSISVSSLPSSTTFSPYPTESSLASQSIRASSTPSIVPRLSPEVSPILDDVGGQENQPNNTLLQQPIILTLGETITISDFSNGSLLNRTGNDASNDQFSEVLFILSVDNSTEEEGAVVARQESLNVSQSVIKVRACVERRNEKREPMPILFLHAFRSSTLAETDLMASRGFMGPFPRNETHSCTMGATIDVPSDTLSSVYLVLSRRVFLESAIVEVSAVQTLNDVAESPLLWNRDLLSIPEKFNVSVHTVEKAKVFVISSWPNLHHIELDSARVDDSGFQHIYGSNSRFPYSVCDDSGTQLVASIVGQHLGVGPKLTTMVPIPVRDCDTPYGLDSILSALSFVKTNAEVSASSDLFVIFDDRLQESGLLNDSTLQKEFEVLANAGVVILVPGRSCISSQPSFVAVGTFGRVVNNRTNSSADEEYVIRSSQCSSMFDVFGPGDFSTVASLGGPESYENSIWGSNVAAGGVLSVLMLMSLDQNRKVNITEAKALLKGSTKTIPLIGNVTNGEFSGNGPALPLLGSGTSLADLRKSLAELSSSNPEENEFIRFLSNLPTGAIIGICLAVGFLLILIIIGGTLAFRRRRRYNEQGEEEAESAPGDDIENVGVEETRVPDERIDRAWKRPPTILDIQSPVPIRPPSARRDTDKSRPVHSQPIRVPVVQRLLSLNRGKESPITKGDKASWFATPKSENPEHPTFNR